MSYLRSLSLILFVLILILLAITGAAVCQQTPSYEVATIRASMPGSKNHDWDRSLNRLSIKGYTLRSVIERAYGLKSNSQIIGGPKWLDDQHFDIEAKTDDTEAARLRDLDRSSREDEYRLLLQSLLAERFKLATTRDVRNLPVYALVVTKSGTKLPSTSPVVKTEKQSGVAQGSASKDAQKTQGYSISSEGGHVKATNISMDAFVEWLSRLHETDSRVVVDKTGLTGRYNFEFNWAPDHGAGIPEDAPDPGLFTALKEELGLELKAEKSHVDVIGVQSVGEPALD